MDILNQFDAIYVINMESRPDRLKAFMKAMATIDTRVPIKIFKAIVPEDKNGAKGCLMSHVAILKQAKERGYKNVMVFEDDAIPTGYNDSFTLPDKWDILYLGYNSHEPLNMEIQNFLKITFCYSTHAIAYNQSIYDEILSAYDAGQIEIIDVWLCRNMQTTKTCLGTYPMLFTQSPGYSDVLKETVNCDYILERFHNNTKHIKRGGC